MTTNPGFGAGPAVQAVETGHSLKARLWGRRRPFFQVIYEPRRFENGSKLPKQPLNITVVHNRANHERSTALRGIPMKIVTIGLAAASVIILAASEGAQSQRNNLTTCLSGRYPRICDHSELDTEQLRLVTEAEHRENLRVCMTGKYQTLCDLSKLTTAEAAKVLAAQLSENLRVCSTGKYPTHCNHGLLSVSEAATVREAERAENLRVCLDGRYKALCNHSVLNAQDAGRASAAESSHQR
jgi:hypothetical protein